MVEEEWETGWTLALGMMLAGGRLNEVDHLGNQISDDALLLLLNGHWEPVDFKLPSTGKTGEWTVLLDTCKDVVAVVNELAEGGAVYQLDSRSLVLLSRAV